MFHKVCKKGGWVAALVLAAGLAAGAMHPAAAQQAVLPTPPQWMTDAGLYFGDPAHIITPLLTNRYLWLWEYFRGGDETRFNLWRSRSLFLFNAQLDAYDWALAQDLLLARLNTDLYAPPYT